MNELKPTRGGKAFQDLSGMKFNSLTAIAYAGNRGGATLWRCRCDCGGESLVKAFKLKSGSIKTCGCGRRSYMTNENAEPETHRQSGTDVYNIWANMRRRCYDQSCDAYRYYGARGVAVCDEWRNSFSAFIADVGPRPSKDHSLDRIDVNGSYCPDNCRWATKRQQQRNKSDNRLIEFRGESKCLAEWAEIGGLPYGTLFDRLRRGMTMERAMTQPYRKTSSSRR